MDFGTKPRIRLIAEGTTLDVKLAPYVGDASLVMVKAINQDVLVAFLALINVKPKGELVKGDRYFMVAADRNEVVDAMPKLFNQVILSVPPVSTNILEA